MRRRGRWAALLLLLLPVWLWQQGADAPAPIRAPERSDATPAPTAASAPMAPAASPAATPATAITAAPAADSAFETLLNAPVAPREALRRLHWCLPVDAADAAVMQQQWQSLGPEAAALEAEEYAHARSWLDDQCGPWMQIAEARRTALVEAWRERAARSPDLGDRLWALASAFAQDVPTEPELVAARDLLEQALRSGRPELLQDLARVLSRGGSPDWLGPYAGPNGASLFGLLACDLGADCGARSEVLRIQCARLGLCGYRDYEALIFDARLSQVEAELVAAHRRILLERIRRGQVDGLFDPVRVPRGP